MKKHKFSFKKILNLDSWMILYGMLSNFGLIIISMLVGTFLGLLISSISMGKFIPLIYLILSIGFYFPIKISKNFKIGYIVGLILGEALLLTLYYFPN